MLNKIMELRSELIHQYVKVCGKMFADSLDVIPVREVREAFKAYARSGLWEQRLEETLLSSYIFTNFLPWRQWSNLKKLKSLYCVVRAESAEYAQNYMDIKKMGQMVSTLPKVNF